METALGILFLSSLGWVFAGIGRRLLRRGIQITYIMPMMPKEEGRMLRGVQAVAIPVMVASAVYLAFFVGLVPGLTSAAAGATLLVGYWRKLKARVPPPPGRHSG